MKEAKTNKQDLGYLYEIFPSIQGEGPLCGEFQLFIRLAGCSLKCKMCDTPESFKISNHFFLYTDFTKKTRKKHNNPISPLGIKKLILPIIQKYNLNTVSVTGGEPLEQSKFTGLLLEQLKKSGISTILETNGLLLEEAISFRKHIDYISLDIKLKDFMGKRSLLASIKKNLSLVNKFKVPIIKIPVTSNTKMSEIRPLLQLIALHKVSAEVIFQPATSPQTGRVSRRCVTNAFSLAIKSRAFWHKIRILPQIHPYLGIK